jgi:hypothetical protein
MSPDEAVLSLVMASLAPTGDVPALAHAIATSGATWDEATMLVAIAFREGSNRLGVVGDNGRALCVFQLHHAPREVLTNAGACTRIALHSLRASVRLCPASPLAAYAGAPCGSAVAGRISRDRDRVRRRAFARLGMRLP